MVFDTGCSHSVTPFRDDFVTKMQKSKVKEMIVRSGHGRALKLRRVKDNGTEADEGRLLDLVG